MNAVPDTLIMKGELSLEKRCILNWDHGKKIEYLEEKGKKQSLKLYLVSHGDRYGGSQCVPGCGQFLDLMSKDVRRKK